jgi:hypothetical protein
MELMGRKVNQGVCVCVEHGNDVKKWLVEQDMG